MGSLLSSGIIFLLEYTITGFLDKGIENFSKTLNINSIEKKFVRALEVSLQRFCQSKEWEYDETAITDILTKNNNGGYSTSFLKDLLYSATNQKVSDEELELWLEIIYQEIANDTVLSNYLLLNQVKFIAEKENIIKFKTIEEFIKENNFGHLEAIAEHQSVWKTIEDKSQVNNIIGDLNKLYSSGFSFINDNLICRHETELILEDLNNNQNIVIHGPAGAGKSGIIEEIILNLEKKEIPYLAIKLDVYTPQNNPKIYGEQLGLPLSPVDCLKMLYPAQNAVLIFDQLDILRWSSANSKTAIDVCKRMLSEVERFNFECLGKISVIFATRTTDMKNDFGINSLLTFEEIHFKQHEVGRLSQGKISSIVGKPYDKFTNKLKELLELPINLELWTRLDDVQQQKEYSSTHELIDTFWRNFENQNNTENCKDIINDIINYMKNKYTLNVPEIYLNKYSTTACEILLSAHILIKKEKVYLFSHQSFYDYFIVRDMVDKCYEDENIEKIIGNMSNQTPTLRYQLLIFLQYLEQGDFTTFIQVSDDILQSDKIRYYIKYCVLEVLNSLQNINEEVEPFFKRYLKDIEWAQAFVSNVFAGNKTLVEWLNKKEILNELWKDKPEGEEQVVFLLQSVSANGGLNLITDFIENNFLTNAEKMLILPAFPTKLSLYSDRDFDCFYSILEISDEYIDIGKYIVTNSQMTEEYISKAIKLFDLLLPRLKNSSNLHIGYLWNNQDAFSSYAKNNSQLLWKKCTTFILNETKNKKWNEIWEKWSYQEPEFNNPTIERFIVFLTKKALVEISKADVELFKSILLDNNYDNSVVMNEVFLYSLLEIENSLANEAILWLIQNFDTRSLDNTGESPYKLETAKKIIEKFSPLITKEIFTDLESFLLKYYPEDERASFKTHLKDIKTQRQKYESINDYDSYNYSPDSYGKAQAYFLPALDNTRISEYTKKQIHVFNKRFSAISLGEDKSIRRITSFSVKSPIPNEAAIKFSDDIWRKKINDDRLKGYRESQAQHDTIASNLKYAILMNPGKYYNLIDSLSEYTPYEYIQAVLDAFSVTEKPEEANEDWQPFNREFIERIVFKVIEWENENRKYILMQIQRIICKRADEEWRAK